MVGNGSVWKRRAQLGRLELSGLEELTAASDRAHQAEAKVRALGEELRRAEASRQAATALSQSLTSRLPALLQVSSSHLQG